jgi:poly(3-hydroxybutyrate) depolymerase
MRRVLGRPPCRDAQVLEWRDSEGSPRYACVIAPKNVETRAPLPLILYFHAAYEDPTSVDKKTGLRKLGARFQLSGDPAHAGFIVLALQGRKIRGGKQGAVFDTDYTGQDNVDVLAMDHFVGELEARKLVDKRRVYALGGSFGGQMAATYAMMRADRVAAFATYASDAPRAAWTCPGPPPPAMVMYRACDAFFPCESVERWIRAREAISAETGSIRLGDFMSDETHCAFKNKCSAIKGAANHRKWPKAREEDILRFFAKHTLAVGP